MLANHFFSSLIYILLFIFATHVTAQNVIKENNLLQTIPFSFTLSNTAKTSAGVFETNGTLIRTLWSGVSYSAGIHKGSWDENNDDGKRVYEGKYTIRVLSNNVNYTWEGVLGNTSAANSGSSVIHSFERMYDIAIAGGKLYAALGYNEGMASRIKIDLSNPTSKSWVLPAQWASMQATHFVTTDGNKVYWADRDPAVGKGYSKWFVYATNVTNDSEVTFATGEKYKDVNNGLTYSSCLDAANDTSSAISGLAVQKNGPFLFVSHKDLNEIHVLNKISGALVKAFPVSLVKQLTVDRNDNLWVVSGTNFVNKYIVSNDGSLASAKISLSGLVSPLAMAVSPDNKTIIVADGSTSQQLKAFSNSNGTPLWVFGQLGGYAANPAVTNDRFYFSDLRRVLGTSLAFEPDGSFWVEDSGNDRAQHYSSLRKFINRIMFLECSRSCSVDKNNPSRVFSDYLEFHIDYTKALSPANGSWTLVNNWGATVPREYDNQYQRVYSVTTFPNNRTYALQWNSKNRNNKLIELLPSGIRTTSIKIPATALIYADGSIRDESRSKSSSTFIWTKKNLIAFDEDNNPIWDTALTIAVTPAVTDKDPVFSSSARIGLQPGEITSTNVVIAFEAGLPPHGSSGYHLGGIKVGDNNWLWRTAMSTTHNYKGPFPTDGKYDIGNGPQYGGSFAQAIDRSIFWGYHGEGWKQGQTNKYNQVYDDGLFVGQFGTTGGYGASEALAEMAGNALSGSFVKIDADTYYLYHCDESWHSGVHRWKITGLNTIKEQNIPVEIPY